MQLLKVITFNNSNRFILEKSIIFIFLVAGFNCYQRLILSHC